MYQQSDTENWQKPPKNNIPFKMGERQRESESEDRGRGYGRQKELHSPSSACVPTLSLRRASSYELSYCAGSVTRMNDSLFKWEF